MKTRFRFFSLFISSISFVCAIQAQSFSLKQSHENGIYKSGDLIRITASPGPNTTDTLWVKILKNNNQVIYEKAIVPEFDDIVIYESAFKEPCSCLLYTSDAADEEDSVDLGGRRIIKKKKTQ